MRVLKFGGTSVGSPERMRQVADIIHDGHRKVVVLSAVSGTTNQLVELTRCLYRSDVAQYNMLLAQLEEKYVEFVEELFQDATLKQQAHEIIVSHFNHLDAFSRDMFTLYERTSYSGAGRTDFYRFVSTVV